MGWILFNLLLIFGYSRRCIDGSKNSLFRPNWGVLLVFSAFCSLYLMIAAFCLTMTHMEQIRSDIRNPNHAFLGFLLCLIWPLLFLAMMFEVMAIRRE